MVDPSGMAAADDGRAFEPERIVPWGRGRVASVVPPVLETMKSGVPGDRRSAIGEDPDG
jgi:hypothetical protein